VIGPGKRPLSMTVPIFPQIIERHLHHVHRA